MKLSRLALGLSLSAPALLSASPSVLAQTLSGTVTNAAGKPLANVSPVTNTMSMIDWQPETDAHAVSYGFSMGGEFFVILDDKGFVTLLEAHAEDGDTHWEFAHKIDVAGASAANLAEGQSFSMAASQHEEALFVVDPVAQAILAVDLEAETTETLLELDFEPAGAVWLGIAEEHEHDDHDH